MSVVAKNNCSKNVASQAAFSLVSLQLKQLAGSFTL